MCAQVGDFNLSRVQSNDPVANSTSIAANNPRWLAPEVIANQVPPSAVTCLTGVSGLRLRIPALLSEAGAYPQCCP
jgi:hypothetical protein